jgi:hypothetical protein
MLTGACRVGVSPAAVCIDATVRVNSVIMSSGKKRERALHRRTRGPDRIIDEQPLLTSS